MITITTINNSWYFIKEIVIKPNTSVVYDEMLLNRSQAKDLLESVESKRILLSKADQDKVKLIANPPENSTGGVSRAIGEWDPNLTIETILESVENINIIRGNRIDGDSIVFEGQPTINFTTSNFDLTLNLGSNSAALIILSNTKYYTSFMDYTSAPPNVEGHTFVVYIVYLINGEVYGNISSSSTIQNPSINTPVTDGKYNIRLVRDDGSSTISFANTIIDYPADSEIYCSIISPEPAALQGTSFTPVESYEFSPISRAVTRLPSGAANGKVYKILEDGAYNGYSLRKDDFVEIYDNTKLLISRLPKDIAPFINKGINKIIQYNDTYLYPNSFRHGVAVYFLYDTVSGGYYGITDNTLNSKSWAIFYNTENDPDQYATNCLLFNNSSNNSSVYYTPLSDHQYLLNSLKSGAYTEVGTNYYDLATVGYVQESVSQSNILIQSKQDNIPFSFSPGVFYAGNKTWKTIKLADLDTSNDTTIEHLYTLDAAFFYDTQNTLTTYYKPELKGVVKNNNNTVTPVSINLTSTDKSVSINYSTTPNINTIDFSVKSDVPHPATREFVVHENFNYAVDMNKFLFSTVENSTVTHTTLPTDPLYFSGLDSNCIELKTSPANNKTGKAGISTTKDFFNLYSFYNATNPTGYGYLDIFTTFLCQYYHNQVMNLFV